VRPTSRTRQAIAESLHGNEVTGSIPEAPGGGDDRQAGPRQIVCITHSAHSPRLS
jgi:hypothetical protein